MKFCTIAQKNQEDMIGQEVQTHLDKRTVGKVHMLQLYWNLQDSPGFLAIVPGTGRPYY